MAPVPNNDYCAPVATPSSADRIQEEQFLDAVQAMRTAGGVTCGTSAPSAALSELRLDARLLCEARAFGADVAVTPAGTNLVDSQGRTMGQRLTLVGYAGRAEAEAYSLRGPVATDALNAMLGDAQMCAYLTDPLYQDVGVGSTGKAYVVTLAAP